MRQDLLARCKGFYGNNVAASKLRSGVEATTNFSHILYNSMFVEYMTGTVDPRDFRGCICCKMTFFSSIAIDRITQRIQTLVEWIRFDHVLLYCMRRAKDS